MEGVILLEKAREAGLSVEVSGMKLVIRGPKSSKGVVRLLLENKPAVMQALEAMKKDEHISPPLSTLEEKVPTPSSPESAWTDGIELIQGAIDRVARYCPQDWKLYHDDTPWTELQDAVDNAYHAHNLEALEKTLKAYEEAAQESFLSWRIQFLQETPGPSPDHREPPTKPCC